MNLDAGRCLPKKNKNLLVESQPLVIESSEKQIVCIWRSPTIQPTFCTSHTETFVVRCTENAAYFIG